MPNSLELTPQEELALIRKNLGHKIANEQPVKYWLDTGEPLLNATLGSPKLGIPYGKIIGLSGFESHGKTALAQELAALAQKDEADIGWLDPENSWDEQWAAKRGLDPSRVVPFRSELITVKEKKQKPSAKGGPIATTTLEERLMTAQELCAEAEAWVMMKHRKRPNGRIFLGVDSVTAFLVEDEEGGGIEDQNMRTKSSLAQFMGQLLRRWTALASSCNVMMVLINQVRIAPGVRFGDPEYSPGGKALLFYSSILARVRRGGGGRLRQGDKIIGMQGIVTNRKNKTGEGSQEGHKVGFKVYWDKPGMLFLPADKIIKEEV
jgi:recombination protein RecA